jgi:small-conductance mechanosensitive channel
MFFIAIFSSLYLFKMIIQYRVLAMSERIAKEYNDLVFRVIDRFRHDIICFAATNDYSRYMNVQQSINFGIRERFGQEGIERAFPTRTLFVKSGRGSYA